MSRYETLSERQKEVLSYIYYFLIDKGRMATLTDISNQFGVHRNSIVKTIKSIEKKGFLYREYGEHLSVPDEFLRHDLLEAAILDIKGGENTRKKRGN